MTPLGYTHPEVEVEKTAPEEPLLRDFFLQALHQHLAGYLAALELPQLINVLTFFGPLA